MFKLQEFEFPAETGEQVPPVKSGKSKDKFTFKSQKTKKRKKEAKAFNIAGFANVNPDIRKHYKL